MKEEKGGEEEWRRRETNRRDGKMEGHMGRGWWVLMGRWEDEGRRWGGVGGRR